MNVNCINFSCIGLSNKSNEIVDAYFDAEFSLHWILNSLISLLLLLSLTLDTLKLYQRFRLLSSIFFGFSNKQKTKIGHWPHFIGNVHPRKKMHRQEAFEEMTGNRQQVKLITIVVIL